MADSRWHELKIDPHESRERLRISASDANANPELSEERKPRMQWQQAKGSTLTRKRGKQLTR